MRRVGSKFFFTSNLLQKSRKGIFGNYYYNKKSGRGHLFSSWYWFSFYGGGSQISILRGLGVWFLLFGLCG